MRHRSALILRGYELADLDAMVRLDAECFQSSFRFSRRTMQRYVEAENAWTLIAADGDTLAGFLIVHTESSVDGSIGYLVTIDVAETYRRVRLGQRMLAEAERWLVKEGVGMLLLHVYVENSGAIRFYEQANYQRAHVEPAFYGEGRDGALYWKRLGD